MEMAQKAKVYQYGSPGGMEKVEGCALEQLRLQNQFWSAVLGWSYPGVVSQIRPQLLPES